jgi:hypothetical protein
MQQFHKSSRPFRNRRGNLLMTRRQKAVPEMRPPAIVRHSIVCIYLPLALRALSMPSSAIHPKCLLFRVFSPVTPLTDHYRFTRQSFVSPHLPLFTSISTPTLSHSRFCHLHRARTSVGLTTTRRFFPLSKIREIMTPYLK